MGKKAKKAFKNYFCFSCSSGCVGGVSMFGLHLFPAGGSAYAWSHHFLSVGPHHLLPVPLPILRQPAPPQHPGSRPDPPLLWLLAPRATEDLHLVLGGCRDSVPGRAGGSAGDHDAGGGGQRKVWGGDCSQTLYPCRPPLARSVCTI